MSHSSKLSSPTVKTPQGSKSMTHLYDNERINSTSSLEMDEDQQQQFYYYHRASMDSSLNHSINTSHNIAPPKIKTKQQIIDYFTQHQITNLLKTKLNEAFQLQHPDPIEFLFHTKKINQKEMVIQQRQHQMKEMDIKHDETLSSIQQSKESMKSEFEKNEKSILFEIKQVEEELAKLKERLEKMKVEGKEKKESLEKEILSLKENESILEKENQSLLKRNKNLLSTIDSTGSSSNAIISPRNNIKKEEEELPNEVKEQQENEEEIKKEEENNVEEISTTDEQ
ncbi:hypothetical protein ABK040_004469 [Willaertia magna]